MYPLRDYQYYQYCFGFILLPLNESDYRFLIRFLIREQKFNISIINIIYIYTYIYIPLSFSLIDILDFNITIPQT